MKKAEIKRTIPESFYKIRGEVCNPTFSQYCIFFTRNPHVLSSLEITGSPFTYICKRNIQIMDSIEKFPNEFTKVLVK